MNELTRQERQDQAWVGAALEDALDRDSPILSWFKAGELPALHDIADGLQADLEGNLSLLFNRPYGLEVGLSLV